MNDKVYQVVTDRIVKLIEENKSLVWQRGWAGGGLPVSFVSGKAYRGFNRMILSFLFADPYFMTYKQVTEKGGNIVKGSKATPIIFWNWLYLNADGKKVKDESQAAKRIPFLRYYNVFNQSQIEGIEFPSLEITELSQEQRIDSCEVTIQSLINTKGLELSNNGNGNAFYRPLTDSVHMPKFEFFKAVESYYSVLFHEICHWTGHSSRLNRELDTKLAPFGSTDYSFEELVAEMGASFLCEEHQIANEQLNVNQAAYLQGWLKKFRGDVKMLVNAGGKAQKAVDFILE